MFTEHCSVLRILKAFLISYFTIRQSISLLLYPPNPIASQLDAIFNIWTKDLVVEFRHDLFILVVCNIAKRFIAIQGTTRGIHFLIKIVVVRIAARISSLD